MEALLRELGLLREAVEGMSGRLEALERENRELREAMAGGAAGRELGQPDQAAAGAEVRAPEAEPEDLASDAGGEAGGRAEDRVPGPFDTRAAPERGLWRRLWRSLGFGGP